MEMLRFGYRYFKKNMPVAILAEALSFIGILAEFLLPLLSGILIDFVIQKGEVKEDSGGIFHFLLSGRFGQPRTLQLFFAIAVAYGILVFLRIVLIYIRDLLQEWIGLKLETELRYRTYEKLMELDSATIADYNSGELLQILNSDTIMFKEMFSHMIAYLGDSIFMLVTTLVLITTIDVSFLVVPLLLMPFLVKAVLTFKSRARENFKKIREKSSEMNLVTQENIAAVRIVRSFHNEELEKEKFGKANTNFLEARLKQIWLSSKFDLTINTIRQTAFVSTIMIGAVLVIQGQLTVGYILASSTYVMRFMSNITSINNYIFNMQQQFIAGLALKNFMEKESRVPEDKAATLHCDTPDIELQDVCVELDGQEILKHIDISIPYGKKLGIVGETGSGKSMLLKTLVRNRDITSGQITISGHDIKEFSLDNLRKMYSYVFQDVFLFSNTIESNIAFSQADINERMVVRAATDAKASEFIDAMPERYKTIVGERGLGISGGQKQRISIARAFLKNAPVFVLDDSTSALDVNTEHAVLKNIYEHFEEKTLIITAHRFSSVVDCDEILYMKDGVVTERGTFEELMELEGSFAHIYRVQQEQQADRVQMDNFA
ncbi:MAG: ABC transporter ATP-binding protein/permease [Clostridium sp.]|nr:ABC transporter ATP-binding protein/permease [Clostridium sp.]